MSTDRVSDIILLFNQEAHRMVAEEMAKRAHAEKALAESDMKVMANAMMHLLLIPPPDH